MNSVNQYTPPVVFHPGETLAEKLNEMKMGIKEFALRTGKPEKTIIAVLKGKSAITPDMSVLFENVTCIPAHFWTNAQRQYDEGLARQRNQAIIEEAKAWARLFPMADLVKCGWIPKKTTIEEKVAELLSFFGMASHKAWENYYFNQQLKLAFRISLASTSEPYALSAWLRMGELQADKQTVLQPYDKKDFKAALFQVKEVMAQQPAHFLSELQNICARAGVKLVYTPCLKKAPINGSSRWYKNTPLIQLTGRHKRNDIFWFTFFHEAGHILLHGQKDIFLGNVEHRERNDQKEKEADEFAQSWTLSPEQEQEILEANILNPLDEEAVVAFAQKFGTHAALIVGRLRYKKLISHFEGQNLIEKIHIDTAHAVA